MFALKTVLVSGRRLSLMPRLAPAGCRFCREASRQEIRYSEVPSAHVLLREWAADALSRSRRDKWPQLTPRLRG